MRHSLVCILQQLSGKREPTVRQLQVLGCSSTETATETTMITAAGKLLGFIFILLIV